MQSSDIFGLPHFDPNPILNSDDLGIVLNVRLYRKPERRVPPNADTYHGRILGNSGDGFAR
jgi:hypothetical protein